MWAVCCLPFPACKRDESDHRRHSDLSARPESTHCREEAIKVMKEVKAIKAMCVWGERGGDEPNWRQAWNTLRLHIPHNPFVIRSNPGVLPVWSSSCSIQRLLFKKKKKRYVHAHTHTCTSTHTRSNNKHRPSSCSPVNFQRWVALFPPSAGRRYLDTGENH